MGLIGRDDGGPAFGSMGKLQKHEYGRRSESVSYVPEGGQEGMSLRDYFAAHAPDASRDDFPSDFDTENMPRWKPYMRGDRNEEHAFALEVLRWHAKRDAIRRYLWADAMLAAREGSTE